MLREVKVDLGIFRQKPEVVSESAAELFRTVVHSSGNNISQKEGSLSG